MVLRQHVPNKRGTFAQGQLTWASLLTLMQPTIVRRSLAQPASQRLRPPKRSQHLRPPAAATSRCASGRPLTSGLRLPYGRRDIIEKFKDSFSTLNNGRSLSFRSRSPSQGSMSQRLRLYK